ncbi:uncharacterized protein DEA37_0014340, partial [Paragonimus westermani]
MDDTLECAIEETNEVDAEVLPDVRLTGMQHVDDNVLFSPSTEDIESILIDRADLYGVRIVSLYRKGFDGIESRNPLYEEYDGLMTAIQLPWLGSNLEPTARPATLEWAFKLKRRQFVLQ